MPIIAMIASGLFTFFNRLILTGIVGKAMALVILSWVIMVLLGGIAALCQKFLSLPQFSDVLGSWGQMGQAFFWVFTVFIQPGLSIAIGSRVVVFMIRRLPIVG